MRTMFPGALVLSAVLIACTQATPPIPGPDLAGPDTAAPATPAPAQAQASRLASTASIAAAVKWPPTGKVPWDWQIGASSDRAVTVAPGVKLLSLDGFTVTAAKVAALKAQGIYTVCYINAGSYEPWRPDAPRYPESLKIQRDADWPDEAFLDVTDVFRPNSVLAGILIDRLKMCAGKGFDALEPDNLQNDENVTGGRITTQQQIDFNGWIADRAHEQGLAVFQKNGPDKILLRDRTGKMMVEKFDGILNEQCQEYSECASLAEYTKRGKLALNVEYRRRVVLNCSLMAKHGINALKKDLGLVGGTMRGYLRETCA